MESRDFVYLQEAYQGIYQLDEEVEIATEYFYEMGLDKEDVEGLIEDLGVYGFNDYVCEILEEYGITNISEAAKWQDRLARGVLNAMERDRKAREQFGKTKVGKALSNIGSKAAAGLTAIGDVGEKGFRAGVGADVRAAERATRPSATSKNADENKGTSPSRVTRKHRSHGRVKSGPRPIGRPSSVHSKTGVRPEKPYRTSRETLALPPVGTTKSGKTLTASQRKMQTAAQNRRLAQRLGIDEEFESWVEGLWEEGYDLSDYTWEGLYEAYIEEVTGFGRVDPTTGTYINRSLRQDRPNRSLHGSSAHLNMTPVDRAAARAKALRASGETEANKRANKIEKFVKGATQAKVDTLRAAEAARTDEKNRLMNHQESYDAILGYLIHEGYANDLESADVIIASMSEEWIMDILEAEKVFPLRKVADKTN